MEKQKAMEEALRIRSDDHHQQQHRSHGIDEEDKRLIDSDHDHDHAHDNKEDHETVVKTIGNKRPYNESNDANPSSPKQKHLSSTKQEPVVVSHMEKSTMEFDHTKASSSCQKKEQDDKLKSARAEMGEVREENQRLKIYLDRIMKDYKTLQMQFYDIVQQEAKKPTTDHSSNDHHQEMEEEEEPSDDLVSLSLGRSSSDSKKHEDQKNKTTPSHDDQDKGLALGLDYRKFKASKSSDATQPLPNLSPENSSEDQAPKEEAGETWPPSKVLKMMKSSGEDEILQQNAVKKARVSVRARCDTPTMNDGCQWRKYGQKISKGNPCPRAYYRCTVAPSCPVRKQVQRCAEDMSILITTYEGNHNHPLPVSATAMASTTSAAASMLLSGPSSSSHPASSTSANLHGLNFYLSDNSNLKQFYLPNSSLSAPSHPTITLDLTKAPSSSSSSQFGRFATANYPQNQRYNSSTTSLNFGSSSEISNNNNSMSWGSTSGLLSYGGTTTHPFIKNQIGARQQQQQQPPMENNVIYQSYMQQQPPKNNLPDPIAAVTKAITADPSFQSALAAALTSIIGSSGGSSGGGANHLVGGGDNNNNNFGQKLKWGDQQFPLASGYSSSQAVLKSSNTNIGCASSFLNKSSTTTNSTQPGSMIFLQPAASLPFSTSNKSASSSPGDHKEQSH